MSVRAPAAKLKANAAKWPKGDCSFEFMGPSLGLFEEIEQGLLRECADGGLHARQGFVVQMLVAASFARTWPTQKGVARVKLRGGPPALGAMPMCGGRGDGHDGLGW